MTSASKLFFLGFSFSRYWAWVEHKLEKTRLFGSEFTVLVTKNSFFSIFRALSLYQLESELGPCFSRILAYVV